MLFSIDDFSLFPGNYFNIFELSETLIYVESKNTYHSWKMVPGESKITLYHKHFSRSWHLHREEISLVACLDEIYNHDLFVIRRIRRSFKDYIYHPLYESNY